jgi:hypothetical protein
MGISNIKITDLHLGQPIYIVTSAYATRYNLESLQVYSGIIETLKLPSEIQAVADVNGVKIFRKVYLHDFGKDVFFSEKRARNVLATRLKQREIRELGEALSRRTLEENEAQKPKELIGKEIIALYKGEMTGRPMIISAVYSTTKPGKYYLKCKGIANEYPLHREGITWAWYTEETKLNYEIEALKKKLKEKEAALAKVEKSCSSAKN